MKQILLFLPFSSRIDVWKIRSDSLLLFLSDFFRFFSMQKWGLSEKILDSLSIPRSILGTILYRLRRSNWGSQKPRPWNSSEKTVYPKSESFREYQPIQTCSTMSKISTMQASLTLSERRILSRLRPSRIWHSASRIDIEIWKVEMKEKTILVSTSPHSGSIWTEIQEILTMISFRISRRSIAWYSQKLWSMVVQRIKVRKILLKSSLEKYHHPSSHLA